MWYILHSFELLSYTNILSIIESKNTQIIAMFCDYIYNHIIT